MRRAPVALAVLLLAFPAARASAQESALPQAERYALRLQFAEYRPTLTGTVQKGFGGQAGTVVDVIDDLAVGDESTFQVSGALQFKKGKKIRGSYTRLDYKGDNATIPSTFNYGQTRFVRGERVVTSIKGGFYSADLEWDLVKGQHGYLGALVGAKVFDTDSVLLAADRGAREVDTVTAPVPVIGLTTRVYFGKVSFEGEFAGMSGGNRGALYEGLAGVRLHLTDRLAAMGGYRYLSLDGKDKQDRLNIKLSGFHFGLEVSL